MAALDILNKRGNHEGGGKILIRLTGENLGGGGACCLLFRVYCHGSKVK